MVRELTYDDIYKIASYNINSIKSDLDDAIIDSLARYKRYIERSNDGVTVNITIECDDSCYNSLERFTIDIVLGDIKTLRVEFNDVKNSSVCKNYLKGYMDVSDDIDFWMCGLSVWAGCFNKCIKAFGLKGRYMASDRVYL